MEGGEETESSGGRGNELAGFADVQALADALCQGNRRALSRGITIVESTLPGHRSIAMQLLELVTPRSGQSVRVGISGAPGVGKSTFIEALGRHIVELGHRLAVLAVDPSSSLSGGSVLGDKTRMQTLSTRDDVFIRPSPAGDSLGGVARRTRESIVLCEAAGFDVVLVETVGVGQSETAVANMTDLFLLLLLPSGGDELQGIKRGIMELADIVLVNKADGEFEAAATRSAADFAQALRLLRPRTEGWTVPVQTCSAKTGIGIESAWERIESGIAHLERDGNLNARRAYQARRWLWEELSEGLLDVLRHDPQTRDALRALEMEVASGRLPATVAAKRLLSKFLAMRGDQNRG
ncbi:MAG: methylmalonyl Co-A mutase-associated GTPase MeaB [Gammaproteobacteria bacterium]|nr:methylmalonyl Co-A mutase-associated GTPase MeaB [Gammaproteobacteria bacterium]